MKFEYKLVSSMCKVLADREPQPALSQPTLAGLRGETVSFQLAYYWEDWSKSYAQVQAECSLPIRLRSVELVPCAYPCHPRRDPGYLATVPGLYPDLLRDLSPQGLPLVSGQWRSLWVDLDLRGAAPGGHSLSLTLLREGGELCQVQLACQVLDVDLPKLPIPHTEWFHSDCLANYYQTEVFSEEYWRIVAEFVKTAAQHKCNMLLTPVFTPPLDTAVGGERRTVQLVDVAVSGGKYSFGFEKLRRWVKMALDCGMEYLEISHLFSQWGAVAAPKVMATVDGTYCQLFGWDTDGGGEEYGGFLMKGLYNGMDDNTDPVTKLFSELWDAIQKGAEGTWGDVQNAWKNAGSWFEQNVKRPVNTAFDGVAQSAKSAFNSAIGSVEGMVNAVIRAVNWLISQLNRIHFDVPDWVPGVGGKSFGINIPTVSTVNLPRLANGAVIPPNHQFAAILGDQRSGTNIEAPAALIKEMLSQALLETQGMRGDVTIEIPVNLDGKTIARIVVPHINNMSVQAGKPVILF